MSSLIRLLRNHIHFLVVVGFLLVVMTWPTIVYAFDTNVFWLVTGENDVWMKLWDAWYAQRFASDISSFYFSDTLFFPLGVSLVFHNFCLPHILVFRFLQNLLPVSNAFNLTFLLIIFANALSAYILLRHLFRSASLALFGAVVFGFSQHVLVHAEHPDVNLVATLPLAIYFFNRGIVTRRRRLIALSGVLVGITAFTSMYGFVCLLLSLGIYMIRFITARWRNRSFWLSVVLLGAIAGSISSARILPMLSDSRSLENALDKLGGNEINTDLAAYFVNLRHPLTAPPLLQLLRSHEPEDPPGKMSEGAGWSPSSYVGYLPMFLVLVGISRTKMRRQTMPWLVLLLVFLVLSLGSVLQINGHTITNFHLPKYYLDRLLPAVFDAFNYSSHFIIGVLLPLAVLTCFGMKALLGSVKPKYRSGLVLICIIIFAFEHFVSPQPLQVHDEEISFLTWLRAEESESPIRLINLPLGRRFSKRYGFYQTLSGYPHVEGLAARTPPDAYQYIDQNLIIGTWRQQLSIVCQPQNYDNYLVAIQSLLEEGFSHIVLHNTLRHAVEIAKSFTNLSPAYQDDYVVIYHVQSLKNACLERVSGYQAALPRLQALTGSSAATPRPNELLMNLMPVDVANDEVVRFYNLTLTGWRDLVHVIHDAQGNVIVSSAIEAYDALSRITAANNIVWLIYNPQQSDPQSDSPFGNWLLRNFKRCRQIFRTEHAALGHFVDRDYPCDLVLGDEPFQVRYNNGIQLSNVMSNVSANRLKLNFWWTKPMIGGFAYSVQIFNAEGEKVQQVDHVIGFEPLTTDTLDLSSLTNGEFVAKLILYDYDTGKSQSGTILLAQLPFQRELAIARFELDK